jgi:RNA polymerase sigma factor (sigma-70 family)
VNKTQLILDNIRIADAVVRKLNIHGESYEDGCAQAKLILCEAAETFNADKGMKFSTWAYLKIEGGMKDWLTKKSRYQRMCNNSLYSCPDSLNRMEQQYSGRSDDLVWQEMQPIPSTESLSSTDLPIDEQVDNAMAMETVFQGLTDDVHAVMALTCLSNHTQKEAAHILGIHSDTVRVKHKAVKALFKRAVNYTK